MNSTITIDDTDDEVLELDASEDVCDSSQSEQLAKENLHSNQSADDSDVIIENEESGGKISTPQPCDDTNIPKPLFKVMFRNESVSRQYRKRIKHFLEELVSVKDKIEENDSNCSLTLEIWESDVDSVCQRIDSTTESEDSQDVICGTLFIEDKQPKLADDLDVPTYGKKYENVFEKSNTAAVAEPKDDCMPKLMCFNCLDNHNLRDCQKPRNQTNINKNRKNFNMKSNAKAVRYHLDEEQRFGHMVPGQLSNSLRRALGLNDNQLPRHIYRMRTLGYPPGWLEEARLQHSGISLINSDGLKDDDTEKEPGQVIDTDKDRYDIKKIHDFPGFNVPPPTGTHDDYRDYWAPQMQAAHSKQTMLLMLQGKQAEDGYKRKKLKLNHTQSKNDSETIPSDMEIEILDVVESVVETIPINGHFLPPLPPGSPLEMALPPPPPPPPQVVPQVPENRVQEQESPGSPIRSSSPPSRTNSPSLSDLENMKNRLLVELQDDNSASNPDTPLKNSFLNSTLKSDMPPPSNENTPEPNRNLSSRSLNTSQGSVKSVDLGTPILQSSSPYNKLPPSEKFSKNICDVMNFENLPDSTGKYEQMTGVLQKVRTTLAKLNQE